MERNPGVKRLLLRRIARTEAACISFACFVVLGIAAAFGQKPDTPTGTPSAGAYHSIQEAVNANPGRMIYLPSGDYEISEKIRIHADNAGLFGPGRIVQTNPNRPIIEIERTSNVQLRDLTLIRPEGKMETNAEAVIAIECRNLVLDNLRVFDNRTRSAAISLRECLCGRISNCLVQNYMRITVDDRTASTDWGYAFNCIGGSGIVVSGSKGTLIQGNRILEKALLPTPEIKRKFDLGRFVKKNPVKGLLVNQKTWDEGYVDNWHQGSAITVSSPETSDCTQVQGNYIENAAQGIDLHADRVIVSHNIINNAFIGMKAMHGSRNVIIIGNQFLKNDLWSIGLMPGAASHAAAPAPADGKSLEANVDGGSIIANNIISDFGYGNAHWVWGGGGYACCPIKFDTGQKPDNPPLTDVLVVGNIVYDTGRDGVLVDGVPKVLPPRYKYAVLVARNAKGLHFANNILHPGTDGVSNLELKP
jgi:hypothetical protein